MHVLSILAAAFLALASSQDDPVAGVWKGTARGDGRFLSRFGAPATFLFERDEHGELVGRAIFQGQETEKLEIRVEDEGRELKLGGTVAGFPVQINLTLDEDRLSGKLVSLGIDVDVEARRLSEVVLAEPSREGRPVDLQKVSEDDWAEDLRFLAAYLPQVHANAFHTQSEEAWHASIEGLAGRLAELGPIERTVAVTRVVAAVGDAHTGLNWREVPGFGSVPVAIHSFADGVFVSGVHEPGADALAARIVGVGDVDIDEALARVGGVVAAENDVWRAYQTPGMLAVPRLLFAMGLSDDPVRVPLVVQLPGGDPLTVSIGFEREGDWLEAPDPNYESIPLWRTNTGRAYWFQLLEERGAVYAAYNACREDPGQSFAEFIAAVLAALDDAGARRLVIDLRNNSGGNSIYLSNQLKRLASHAVVGEPGGLVALTGPRTYSSGMRAAYELRDRAGATLIGEPTGGKPNAHGDVRWFRLPHTKLQVLHSTKYFRPYEESDPPSIEPAVLVELRSDEFFGGLDPVLERALE